MSSQYWNEPLAARYRAFQYDFADGALSAHTIIVAGGTGGLGAATVALLAREGARLVVGFRSNRGRAQELQKAIREQFRQEIILVEGDIADAAVRTSLLDAAAKAGKPLAGAVVFPGDPARVPFDSLGREAMAASLEANYIGPALLAKDIGLAMEKGSGGSLVLLATMQAVAPFDSSLNYAAPKAALVHAARVLARQWTRVRVNVVAPGATVAGMAEASVSSGKYDSFVTNGTVSRFGRPEDAARAVRFFLEPDNYVTGQILVVDGGLTLRR